MEEQAIAWINAAALEALEAASHPHSDDDGGPHSLGSHNNYGLDDVCSIYAYIYMSSVCVSASVSIRPRS